MMMRTVLTLSIVAVLLFVSAIGWASGVTWEAERMLPVFQPVKSLDVVDVARSPGEIKLLVATLQGLVNREEPRLYMIEEEGGEGKFTWLRTLDVDYTSINPWQAIEKYRDVVKGLIVYDPTLPDTINVATTLAGIHDGVVVSPELAATLQEAPYELPVAWDLQGRFESKLEAYRWQLEELWPQANQRMLIGLSPGHPIPLPRRLPQGFDIVIQERTQERDARNRRVYQLDLTSYLREGQEGVYLRFDDAFPSDGWGPSVHQVTAIADGQVIAQFIPGSPGEQEFLYDGQRSQVSPGFGGHRFADNDRHFIYRFSPPQGTQELIVRVDMWNQFRVSASSERPPAGQPVTPFGFLRDYAVANKAMVFWLQPHTPQERALFEEILSQVEPGTPYLGWFPDDVAGEFSGVELVSRYGVYVLAADWFNNLTVFSGTHTRTHTETHTGAHAEAHIGTHAGSKVSGDEQAAPSGGRRETPQLENKIYVTLVYSEGDNLQYNQHRMRILWDDPNRGRVPLNWTSSPLLLDAAPAILDYYRETATQNDLIIAGPSGGGYFYPNVWPVDSFAEFLISTRPYLEGSGMTIPYVLNRINERNVPLSEHVAAAYADEYDPPGLFLSWENQTYSFVVADRLPVSVIRGIGSFEEGRSALAEARAGWDGQSPMFVALGLLAWSITPTDAYIMSRSLGDEFEIVLADEYFALLRQSQGLEPY